MTSHHSGQETLQQSETIQNFKIKFENSMKQFHEKVESRVNDNSFSGDWKDVMGGVGISVGALGGGTAITVLGIIGVLTAAATAGAGLAVAAVGIGATAGYSVYRAQKKKKQYKRALDLLQLDDYDEQVKLLSNRLANIYQFQLENCSPTDAEKLALACFASLKHEMFANKHLKFNDLLSASHLQALIVKSAKKVKKEAITINGRDDEKANTRGAIKHAALYCEENGQFYRCSASKPTKYGVLFFSTRQELDEYKLQIEKIKGDKDSWHYEKMSAGQVKLLMRNELFHRKGVNDEGYQSISDSDQKTSSEERIRKTA